MQIHVGCLFASVVCIFCLPLCVLSLRSSYYTCLFGRFLSTGLSPYVFSEGIHCMWWYFSSCSPPLLPRSLRCGKQMVDLVILAVCISLNDCGCFVQSRACHDLFVVFSSYFANFCVPLFVGLLRLYFNASVTTVFFLEHLWIILNPLE